MSDWEQTGRDLEQEWTRQRQGLAEQYKQHIETVSERLPMLGAVIAYNRGDHGAIQRLLRDPGYDLTGEDRETLAQFLDGGFAPDGAGVGRPKSNERWVATKAGEFYEEWKALNNRLGISDHGQSGEMKERAVAFVVRQFMPPWLNVDEELAIENMRRSKSRQN